MTEFKGALSSSPQSRFGLRLHYEGGTGHAPDGVWVLFSRPEGGYLWPVKAADYCTPTRAPDFWGWVEELGESAEVPRALAQRVATAAMKETVYGGDMAEVHQIPTDAISVKIAEELDRRASSHGEPDGRQAYRRIRSPLSPWLEGLVDRYSGADVEPENSGYATALVRRRLDAIFGTGGR